MCGHAILLARQTNEATLRYLQGGKKRRSLGADVLGHCPFTFSHIAVDVNQFESHIDGYFLASVDPLIGERQQYIFRLRERLKSSGADVVTCPRLCFIAQRRTLADERDADIEQRLTIVNYGLHVSHDRPDPVLVFHVIKHTQLPWHRDRHVQQTAPFSRVLEGKTGPERRHVNESGDLGPFVSRCLTAPHANRQMQWETLANPFPISFFTHGSRRT